VVTCAIDPLAKAIERMVGADRPAMGARARALVEDKYSWRAIGAALERLYAGIIAERAA
jgi:glycosyltransferase involved in cell wall biosynthesis